MARRVLEEAVVLTLTQHGVAEHVREGLSLDGHGQLAGPSEIGLHGLTGTVNLREENLLVRPGGSPPLLYSPLQGPKLSFLVLVREPLQQILKKGSGLKSRVRLETCFDLCPVFLEGVGAGSPVPRLFHLRGKSAVIEVLCRRIAAHAGFNRGYPSTPCLGVLFHQLSHLRIRYHSVGYHHSLGETADALPGREMHNSSCR